MTETMAYWYSSESTRPELSNKFQYEHQKSLHPLALDESSLSIDNVKDLYLNQL